LGFGNIQSQEEWGKVQEEGPEKGRGEEEVSIAKEPENRIISF